MVTAFLLHIQMDPIENEFDINIDYYVKINFKGVVNLVNALNGVDVEVPRKLCTDNSSSQRKISNIKRKSWTTSIIVDESLIL